ncbi:MAG: energy transducer TonB [Thermodesulfobacteriota bacterium]|jgi:protein TonB
MLHIGLLGVAAGLLVTHGRATTALLKVTLLQSAVPLPVGAHKGPEVDARREEKPPESTSPPPKPQTLKPKMIAPSVPKMKKPQPPKEVVAPTPAAPPFPAASTLPPSQEGLTDGVGTADHVVEKQGLGGSNGSMGTTANANAPRNGGGGASARPDYGVNPKPPYPFMARRMGAQGVVLLRVHVRADGSVAEVEIGQSSGFLLLDKSAVQTVRESWRFIPARLDGVPIESWVEVPIRFVLGDS